MSAVTIIPTDLDLLVRVLQAEVETTHRRVETHRRLAQTIARDGNRAVAAPTATREAVRRNPDRLAMAEARLDALHRLLGAAVAAQIEAE